MGGLPTGTYRIRFHDYSDAYTFEYYDDAPNIDSATNIVVISGSTTVDKDASLADAGHISGTVTAETGETSLPDIEVCAVFDNNTYWEYISCSYTDGGGFYDFGGLAAGTFYVSFYDYGHNYINEFYDNTSDIDTAEAVAVTAGLTTSPIDAALAQNAGSNTLDISLANGWNMISSYIDPSESALESLLVDIESNMILMKNGDGQVYWPSQGINDIGSWNVLDGYQIYMANPDTL